MPSGSDILTMRTMNYTTLIFDAFDTVIHINESKLPTHHAAGKTVPTTAPAVHKAYCGIFGKKEFDVFYDAFSQSFNQVSIRRRADLREIVSQERFKIMLELLNHPAYEVTDDAIEQITRAHMAQLRESFEVRPEVFKALEWAKSRYRVGMISNFGYAPALYDSLDHFGIRAAFDTVVVSAEVGWCKPHRLIFDHAFEKMNVRPAEALFLGDQLYVDVYGALNAGMDVVWVETERQDGLPPGMELPPCKPTYTVRLLSDVIALLED
jgi:putative hydrolase of the HAD superfamily